MKNKFLGLVILSLSLSQWALALTFTEAKAFCSSRGQRLPNLVEAFNKYGVKMLSKEDYSAGRLHETYKKADYRRVETQDFGTFYYLAKDYEIQDGPFRSIWLSSMELGYNNSGFAFETKLGRLSSVNTTNEYDHITVECADL